MTPEQLEALKQALEISKAQADADAAATLAAEGRESALQQLIEAQQEAIKLGQAEIQLAGARGESTAAYSDQLRDATAELSRLRSELNDYNQTQQETAERTQEADSAARALAAGGFGGLGAALGFLMKGMTSGGGGGAGGGGMLGALRGLGSGLTRVTSGAALAAGGLTKFYGGMKQAILEADKAMTTFVGTTGAIDGSKTAIVTLGEANMNLGIGFAKMGESLTALRSGFADFTGETVASQSEIATHTALMAKMGVAADVSTQMMNELTISLGLTTAEVMETQRDISGLAIALGQPPRVINEQFMTALPRLARFGDQATDIFQDLAIAARETGTSVSDLTQLFGAQMDTFEGSARIAGQLNRVLGTDLFSSTELLMATDEERLRIMQERMRMSGVDFANMDQFQRQAIANAAGIEDVNTAMKLFGQNQSDVAMRLGDTTLSFADMEEISKQSTDIMQKMNLIIQQTTILIGPMVETISSALQGLLDLQDNVAGGGATVAGASMAGGIGLRKMMMMMGGTALRFAGPAGMLLSVLGPLLAGGISSAIGDGIVRSDGTVVPIDNKDDVMAAKPGGPIMQAAAASAAATPAAKDKTLVVQVMLNGRQVGEAIRPHIQREILGTA